MSTALGNLGSAKAVSASGNVKAVPGGLLGILCSASTSGTVALYDDAATGTTVPIAAAFPVVAGTFYPLPICFANGLNVVLGGTASITLVLA